MSYECGVCLDETNNFIKCKNNCSYGVCAECYQRIDNKCPQCRGIYHVKRKKPRKVDVGYDDDDNEVDEIFNVWTVFSLVAIATCICIPCYSFGGLFVYCLESKTKVSLMLSIPLILTILHELINGSVSRYRDTGYEELDFVLRCNLMAVFGIVLILIVYNNNDESVVALLVGFTSLMLGLSVFFIILDFIGKHNTR